MTNLTLEDAIELAGGPVSSDNCPSVIPPDQLTGIFATLMSAQNYLNAILPKELPEKSGYIALTMSSSFTCEVKQIKDGFVLLVPLGMPARMSVFARLLLRYLGKERRIRMIRSALDEVKYDPDKVPPLLKPLLLEYLEPESFWKNLHVLDESIDFDQRLKDEVIELVHLSLVYLLSREFTHFVHGHFDLLDRLSTEKHDLSKEEIIHGIETDADAGAAVYSVLFLKNDIDRKTAAGKPAQMEAACFRLAYAVTMFLTITDTHKKFSGAYGKNAFNHPAVRFEIFTEHAARVLNADKSALDLWRKFTDEGWVKCVFALENMNIDATEGVFGKLPERSDTAPLHTLSYSAALFGVSERYIHDEHIKAEKLMKQVGSLLPYFQKA